MNQREHKRTHRMAPAAIALCALLTGCQAGTGDAQEPTPASHDEEIVITSTPRAARRLTLNPPAARCPSMITSDIHV